MADGAFRQVVRRLIPRRIRWLARTVFRVTTGLYLRNLIRDVHIVMGHLSALEEAVVTLARSLGTLTQETERRSVYVGDHRILTRIKYGPKMLLDSRDTSISMTIALHGVWEPPLTSLFLEIVRPGMTVVDIGAHAGYYTLLACSRTGPSGRVIAFEPDPRSSEILSTNVRMNGFSGRCSCVRVALSNRRGTQTLHRATEGPGWNTLWTKDDRLPGLVETTEVETISLDDYLEANGCGAKVDVVKMDAEGSEGLIIEGMTETLLANNDIVVICEFIPDHIKLSGVDPMKMLTGIADMGFQLSYIDHDGRIKAVPVEGLLAEGLLAKGRTETTTLFLKRNGSSQHHLPC